MVTHVRTGLAQYGRKTTITSREIQTAVRIILPGELSKHAISEGTKSVTKYSSTATTKRCVLDLQSIMPSLTL